MANKYDKVTQPFAEMRNVLIQNTRGMDGSSFLTRYRQTLRVTNPRMSWADWINTGASRDGYGMEGRFKGWGFNSPFPAVPFVFLLSNGQVVPDVLAVLVSTPKNGEAVFVTIMPGNEILGVSNSLTKAVPVFINKIGGSNKLARDAAELCGQVQKLYDQEVRDDLQETMKTDVMGNPWVVNIDGQKVKASTISTTSKLKEKNTMKNTKADNFIQDQKAIAKEIASLNAGRVSNKVVKEAMRPLVALLFKPTWTQKLAMKLTGAKNPLDEFMNTPYADLLCAQLFKTAIDMREVDNKHVKKTANSAVIYAGLKVTEELPVEDLIDKAIKQVTDATTSVLGKSDVSDS